MKLSDKWFSENKQPQFLEREKKKKDGKSISKLYMLREYALYIYYIHYIHWIKFYAKYALKQCQLHQKYSV